MPTTAVLTPAAGRKGPRNAGHIDFPAAYAVKIGVVVGATDQIQLDTEASTHLHRQGIVTRQGDVGDGELRLAVVQADVVAHQVIFQRGEVLRRFDVLAVLLVWLDGRSLIRAQAC